MPDFTIYTFGDVEIFRAAFAGVAMIFSPNDFFVSGQGVGLGALAGLGLLISLFITLLGGIFHGKIDVGGMVVVVIAFCLMFVPHVSVNIEDYNGSAIAKVDNVPLGVALPAGLVSGLANELNLKMGTAFSTVDGYPSGVNTPGALTSPLKILFSLRKAATVVPDKLGREVGNLDNLVAYCLAGRGNNYNVYSQTAIAGDPILAMTTMAQQASGLTMYTPPGDDTGGTLTPCSVAAPLVEADIQNFMAGQSAAGGQLALAEAVLTAAATSEGAAQVLFNGSKPKILPIGPSTQTDIIATLFQESADNAANFVKAAMFMPFVTASFECAESSGNPVDWAPCMPFQSATLQYQEDSAAAGSFFQRIMFHGMNALFFLWICLSPVVATVMLILGQRGLKLAGSYLLFGAWAVSWYVGASIVNFYMLMQLQNEVSMLGGIGAITKSTIGPFFNAISMKIALAGDMMSQVPLIMMTVMSGSMYGMVQVAGRWGAKDYYDEKVNSPSLVGSAPIAAMQNQYDVQRGGQTIDKRFSQGENFEIAHFNKWSTGASVQSQTQYAQKVSDGINQGLKEIYQHGDREQLMQQLGETYGITDNNESRAAIASGKGIQYLTEKSSSFSTSNFHQEGASLGFGGEAGVGGSISGLQSPQTIVGKDGAPFTPLDENGKPRLTKGTPLVTARGGASASLDMKSGEMYEGKTGTGSKGSIGGSRSADRTDATGTQTRDGLDWSKVSSIGKFMEHSYGEEMAHQFGNEHSKVKSFLETGTVTSGTEISAGGKASYSPSEMLNAIQTSGADAYLAEHDAMMRTGGHSKEYQQLYADAERQYRGAFPGNARSLASLKAMERLGEQYGDSVAKDSAVNAVRMATGSRMDVPTVTSSTRPASYSPDIASRAETATAVGPHDLEARKHRHVAGPMPQNKDAATDDPRFASRVEKGQNSVKDADRSNQTRATKFDPTRS